MATGAVVLYQKGGLEVGSIPDWASSNSFGLVFSLVALAYLIGGLVEVIATVYFGVFVGNLAWAIVAPRYWYTDWPKRYRYAARAIVWYPLSIALLVWGTFRSLFGLSDYEWKTLETSLGGHQLGVFRALDEATQRGLKRPFGPDNEAAWFDLYRYALSERSERRLVALQARNLDILVTTTAVFLSAAVLAASLDQASMLGKLFFGSEPVDAAQSAADAPPLVTLLQILALGLLVGTVQIAQRNTKSALSILAGESRQFRKEASDSTSVSVTNGG